MTISRKAFFDKVRASPFDGSMTISQVQGMGAILSEWERRGLTDLRWLAYMLATTFHETAHTMQPIHEIGKRDYFNKYEPGTKIGATLGNTKMGDGYLYRGRGFVQLTGRANYDKMRGILGVDLIGNPDLALDPKNAAAIMFEGMSRGTFTGKRLTDYFNASATDYVNARKIINGTDRAELIAGYARSFYTALNAAQAVAAQPAPPDVEPVNVPAPVPKPVPQAAKKQGLVAALIAAFAAVVAYLQDHPLIIAGVAATLIIVAFIAWRLLRKKDS